MAANNIALMPLQRESGADSFLSALAQGQQMDTQAQANQRAQAQEQRAQSEFDMNRKLRAVDILGAAVDQIPDGDAQKLNETVTWAVKAGLIDPNEAAQWNDVNKLPQIRAMSQTARALIAQRQKAEMDQKEFGLKSRLTEAQIGSERAQANAANALATQRSAGPAGGIKAPVGYQYVLGEDGQPVLQPIPGGPADPQVKPQTEDQSKSSGYAQRLRAANAVLEQQPITDALLSGYNTTAIDVPLVGNALVSSDYQQGDQAARDFLNAQLRRESGAVIGASEFGSGSKQYFPQYGDKKTVLAQKAVARKLAIANMLSAAGPRFKEDADKALAEYRKAQSEFDASTKGSKSNGWSATRVK